MSITKTTDPSSGQQASTSTTESKHKNATPKRFPLIRIKPSFVQLSSGGQDHSQVTYEQLRISLIDESGNESTSKSVLGLAPAQLAHYMSWALIAMANQSGTRINKVGDELVFDVQEMSKPLPLHRLVPLHAAAQQAPGHAVNNEGAVKPPVSSSGHHITTGTAEQLIAPKQSVTSRQSASIVRSEIKKVESQSLHIQSSCVSVALKSEQQAAELKPETLSACSDDQHVSTSRKRCFSATNDISLLPPAAKKRILVPPHVVSVAMKSEHSLHNAACPSVKRSNHVAAKVEPVLSVPTSASSLEEMITVDNDEYCSHGVIMGKSGLFGCTYDRTHQRWLIGLADRLTPITGVVQFRDGSKLVAASPKRGKLYFHGDQAPQAARQAVTQSVSPTYVLADPTSALDTYIGGMQDLLPHGLGEIEYKNGNTSLVKCHQGSLIRTLDHSGKEVRNNPDVIQQFAHYRDLVDSSALAHSPTLSESTPRYSQSNSPSTNHVIDTPLSPIESARATWHAADSPTSTDAKSRYNRARWSEAEHNELLDAVASSVRNDRVQWPLVCEKLPHRGLSALRNRY